ncbi:hypothetical protein PTSG_09793 [Salpingoeca rosetta]|uniref:Uncharacterized protein n=1 Tax=Salpingoeca rosetta (strain ATCC 50818 / BSB-021) TaxID=946362 RepID=F2UP28_SALR5|nr:uncharacterized protein PTSG_09793 [Salpingoeca rosetta]EGD79383.1 hypothetical protein PTSG_09793 [Salpingoeca rosetta]|eukprot:XP_004989152.1 hypothetical protein PTSG_09793 [Salpingoeca rosetta]
MLRRKKQPPSTHLSLAFQDVAGVPRDVDGSPYKSLDLSHNRVSKLHSLKTFTNLESLVLDNNKIGTHVQFPFLPHLTRLWLNNNEVDNLVIFIDKVAVQFPKLKELSMLNNPAAPSFFNGGTKDEYHAYRLYVISRIPTLEVLDQSKVTVEERKAAVKMKT